MDAKQIQDALPQALESMPDGTDEDKVALRRRPKALTMADGWAWPGRWRLIAEIRPPVREVIRLCVTGKEPWPLLLYGNAGSGKTCALLCVHDNYPSCITTWVHLRQDYRALQTDGLVRQNQNGIWKVQPKEFWGEIADHPLLIIDDLEPKPDPNGTHAELLKGILDNRKGKATLLATNMTPSELERLYGDPVVSRLAAGTMHQMPNEDRRLH